MVRAVLVIVLMNLLGGCMSASAEAKQGRKITHVEIRSTQQSWTSTGLTLAAFDEVTLSATDKIDAGLPTLLEPKHVLWGRVGAQGEIFQIASNHHSFQSESPGELFISFSPSGLLFANKQGEWIDSASALPDAPIMISVTSILWPETASRGITSMLKSNDPTLVKLARAAEIELDAKKTLPDDFNYLWFLGSSNIFEKYSDGSRQGVHINTDNDGGIIKKPLDIPLSSNTKISFDWLYRTLPALASETSAASHDYMSIAIEFDNGHDITWMWSRDLPEESSFACPLPGWESRETHIVLQSGSEDLGKWYSHTRSIQDDYQSSVGGEHPSKIVVVWIIGNAIFGRQLADAIFANVVIEGDGKQTVVF
jgi:hypothetical protein